MRAPGSRSVAVLKLLLALAVLSTTVHYAHNFVYAGDYPPVPILFPGELAYRVGIAVFYPLLTAVGVWGVREYARGRTSAAVWALVAYAQLGLTSPGHYLGGVPDVPWWATATIFTDFLTCAALVGFAWWAHRRARTASSTTSGLAGA